MIYIIYLCDAYHVEWISAHHTHSCEEAVSPLVSKEEHACVPWNAN